jgi:hypothetical protein
MATQTLDARAILDATVSEAHLLADVIGRARALGWRAYHTHRSQHSESGYPDVCLVRPPRLAYMELKREGKEPTAAQAAWLADLAAGGAEVYVIKPHDWSSGRVEEILT